MAALDIQLREALGDHLGEVLTPELAASIFAAAFASPDLSHDPAPFGVQRLGDYTLQVERMREVLDELHPLHQAHWLETERHRHGLPLNPDYTQMLARERAGTMLQFTLRHRPTALLVGNLRMYLGTSMHSGTCFAEEDTLYIAPDHRGGWRAMHLLRFAETALRGLGVREIRADSKVVNRADVLMRRMGYEQVAIKFVKIFPEGPDDVL